MIIDPGVMLTTVTTPAKLGGRSKATDKGVLDIFHDAFKGFTSEEIKATAAYGSIARRNIVMFLAFESDVPDAKEMITVAATTWFKTEKFHGIAPGPLGGAAQCTNVVAGHTKATHCIWASSFVFGMIYFFFLDPKQAEKEFVKARAQIEVAA